MSDKQRESCSLSPPPITGKTIRWKGNRDYLIGYLSHVVGTSLRLLFFPPKQVTKRWRVQCHFFIDWMPDQAFALFTCCFLRARCLSLKKLFQLQGLHADHSLSRDAFKIQWLHLRNDARRSSALEVTVYCRKYDKTGAVLILHLCGHPHSKVVVAKICWQKKHNLAHFPSERSSPPLLPTKMLHVSTMYLKKYWNYCSLPSSKSEIVNLNDLEKFLRKSLFKMYWLWPTLRARKIVADVHPGNALLCLPHSGVRYRLVPFEK